MAAHESAEQAMSRLFGNEMDRYNELQAELIKLSSLIHQTGLTGRSVEQAALEQRKNDVLKEVQAIHNAMTKKFVDGWVQKCIEEEAERRWKRQIRWKHIMDTVQAMNAEVFTTFERSFAHRFEDEYNYEDDDE